MITLEASDLEWIKGSPDDPNDQCAHGRVQFQVNERTFVQPGDGLWTLSASALYLLRSITEDHTKENPISEWNFLFPCCGFCTWVGGERFNVMCMGCNTGIDVEVLHQPGHVTLRSAEGTETVPQSEWNASVLAFVASVEGFYARCSPKVEILDEPDRQGWAAFWQEWKERYSAAFGPLS